MIPAFPLFILLVELALVRLHNVDALLLVVARQIEPGGHLLGCGGEKNLGDVLIVAERLEIM